jgi:hypothetical protein
MSMSGYEDKAMVQDRNPPLNDELQRLHKQISELDMMVDTLSTRVESLLSPSSPSVVDDSRLKGVTAETHSPMRGEIRIISSRLEVVVIRFQAILNRIDL